MAQNLIRQFNKYLSLLDCPFPDDSSSNKLTDAQKRELLESIIPFGTPLPKKNGVTVAGLDGSMRVPIDANGSAAANAGNTNWELKESQPGIIEPTIHSYE